MLAIFEARAVQRHPHDYFQYYYQRNIITFSAATSACEKTGEKSWIFAPSTGLWQPGGAFEQFDKCRASGVPGAGRSASGTQHDYFHYCDQCPWSAWSGMQRTWNPLRLLSRLRSVPMVWMELNAGQVDFDLLSMLRSVLAMGVDPNIITFSDATSACEKTVEKSLIFAPSTGLWQRVGTFEQFDGRSLISSVVDTITSSIAISS